MIARSLGRLTRNTEAPLLLESFFVAAVASFLGIRWFLVLLAVMLLLAFLDRSVQQLAAVVAGLGFGTFIDEIGKFVTADNDYFYRPAVALIYDLFVATFLAVSYTHLTLPT